MINGTVGELCVLAIKNGAGPRSILSPPNHFNSLAPHYSQELRLLQNCPGVLSILQRLGMFCLFVCFPMKIGVFRLLLLFMLSLYGLTSLNQDDHS